MMVENGSIMFNRFAIGIGGTYYPTTQLTLMFLHAFAVAKIRSASYVLWLTLAIAGVQSWIILYN